jgi:DNA primase catalytic core
MSSNSIFSQMDIVKIIESFGIQLKKVGDEYHGSIPPVGSSGESLHVFKTNTWFCNKNHTGGGIIDFIQFMDHSSKHDAYVKACDISGLQPELLSEDEVSLQAEAEEVYNTLTEATKVFHANLNEKEYQLLFSQWGITKESADEWHLGYASLARDLKGFDPKSLTRTGLTFSTGSGNMGGEYYNGRIIFPYFQHGKVCYMSGRETSETPGSEEGKKYKYLRLHSEKNPQISEFVNNKVFFGEDKVNAKNTDFCIITEGLADCIIANQYGFPCLALGSTGVSKECQERLITLLKNEKCVYLCFDNDENKAGQNGALKLGQTFFDAGIRVKVIGLPRGSESKMDIAEFMKGKQAEDLETLKNKAMRFIPYSLTTCHKSESKVENLETAEEFVKERLLNVDELYRNGYISDDIKRFFGFVDRDLMLLLKVANSAVKDKQVDEEINSADNSSKHNKDDIEIELIKSLETQNGKGLLTCEKWVNESKLSFAKIQPETLSKKLVNPKEKQYSHSEFITAIKEHFLLSSYETDEIYKKIHVINSKYHKEKKRLINILIRLQNYLLPIKERAEDLLKTGDPLEFIITTWGKSHIGDEAVGKTLPVCVGSTFIIGDNAGTLGNNNRP